jgi:hypothetical protein
MDTASYLEGLMNREELGRNKKIDYTGPDWDPYKVATKTPPKEKSFIPPHLLREPGIESHHSLKSKIRKLISSLPKEEISRILNRTDCANTTEFGKKNLEILEHVDSKELSDEAIHLLVTSAYNKLKQEVGF